MKALSLKQPWAWLVVKGYKNIEFRWWASGFRGECLIHAGKKPDRDAAYWLLERQDQLGLRQVMGNIYYFSQFWQDGAIIGKVTIVDCLDFRGAAVLYRGNPWLAVTQGCPGNKCFILKEPVLFEKPIPCKGKLGFFEPEVAVI